MKWAPRLSLAAPSVVDDKMVSMPKASIASDSNPQNTQQGYPWIQASLTVVLGLVVAGFRRPGVWMSAQFWAEDADVFLGQADGMGRVALSLPHAGYHHLFMRLWAGM
ncbi:MAG: hypothetical protein J6386_18260 [Candidatus Synoicihabitans palmerolidicus]|nr:hypothetical protein [Candidatus Synoicihabitans palmerolidicus]